VHLWRGWPRRASEEFKIIRSMDPAYLPSETGRIAALNTLDHKLEARGQADALLEKHPRKKWVRRLVRNFEVEGLNENRFEFAFSREQGGITDVQWQDTLSAPLSLYSRLYGFVFWRRTWDEDPDATARALGDDTPTYFKRTGLGANHIFNSDWAATQQFSVNYDHGDEFGSLSRLTWTPDDHWHLAGQVDTFSTDVAKRARAAGVTATKLSADAGYRESEWRQYTFNVSRQLFSDGNNRDEILLGYEHNLFVKNDWRMRVTLNLYGTRNSDWDSPEITYYNPKNAWELSLTHMTEQTVWNRYAKSFVHRLYLTIGDYDQYAYSGGLVGSVRYEQAYDFSDTQSLSWGTTLGRNLYDGDSVGSISMDVVWSMRF
jgi:biofilm PGA synthesis protein PgaA